MRPLVLSANASPPPASARAPSRAHASGLGAIGPVATLRLCKRPWNIIYVICQQW